MLLLFLHHTQGFIRPVEEAVRARPKHLGLAVQVCTLGKPLIEALLDRIGFFPLGLYEIFQRLSGGQ